MLHELEVLEARRIADLARNARSACDAMLQSIRDTDLQEPPALRGEHTRNIAGVLNLGIGPLPEYAVLQEAVAGLPRDIREKLWLVAAVGRGDCVITDWDEGLRSAAGLPDDVLTADLIGEPDLHDVLRKGLYMLGAASLPGDAG